MQRILNPGRGRITLLPVLLVGIVSFGIWHQLSSRASDGSDVQAVVVDSRETIRGVIRAACLRSGGSLVGEINGLRLEDDFAQADAICAPPGNTSNRPTFFTLKFAEGAWAMLAQGFDPPSPARMPDPKLPLQFADGD